MYVGTFVLGLVTACVNVCRGICIRISNCT